MVDDSCCFLITTRQSAHSGDQVEQRERLLSSTISHGSLPVIAAAGDARLPGSTKSLQLACRSASTQRPGRRRTKFLPSSHPVAGRRSQGRGGWW